MITSTQSHLPVLYFDGGSRGNPGKAAGAAVIVLPDGKIYKVSQYIQRGTCNEAEYRGLILGLQKAQELKIEELEVRGDSQLVINQINGLWKVKSENLKGLYKEACELTIKFKKIKINWVARTGNALADTEVNNCLDRA